MSDSTYSFLLLPPAPDLRLPPFLTAQVKVERVYRLPSFATTQNPKSQIRNSPPILFVVRCLYTYERGLEQRMERLESPDEVLVMAAILGNLDAFEELVLRYRAAVVRLARTIVGNDDAEDVAQDSLLLAFKALPTLEEPTRFAAWLSAITRHRAFRFSQRERAQLSKRVAMDDVLLEKIEALSQPLVDRGAYGFTNDGAFYGLESESERGEVMSALDKLPNEYAMPLRLRFQDEMPLKRIAAFMGVPLSTVKWRLHQGKKLLRERLSA